MTKRTKRQPESGEPRTPASLDLFCGIGGLALGLQRAGVRCLGGVDHWADALRTFSHNNPDVRRLQADLTAVDIEGIEKGLAIDRQQIDIVAGGPPCQGFSTVGKRLSEDPRNVLWLHFLDLVAAVRPAYVLIENVEGLVVMERGGVRDAIISSFGELGYHMTSRLVRAADYGVPQLRKRVIFLGWLEGVVAPKFPSPITRRPVTVAEAIDDLPPLGPGETADLYDRPPRTDYQRARRGPTRRLANHQAANHPPELVEIIRHIPDGGNRKSIPDHLQPSSGFHNSYSRLASDRPAIAVTQNMRKPSSARATHPTQHRGLTVREGLRLQSFDDSFEVLGSRTSQYLQVGNAVPPLLAEAVGRELVAAFRATPPHALEVARKNRRPVEKAATSLQYALDLS